MTYDEEVNYCRTCGMPLEKGRDFCTGCGAEILSKDKAKKDEPTETRQTTDYLKESLDDLASDISTTVDDAPTNSIIAILLGAFGCLSGCFILPIVGLRVVKKAEEKNEDTKLVNIARILNSVLVVFSIIVLIGIVLAIVLPLTL